jgi:drug/metabolite transporter (DMT)-like permease
LSQASLQVREHRKGVLLMIAATLCWSTAGVSVRNLTLTDGWEITFWRSLFMTVFILGVLVVQHRGATLQRIRDVGMAGVLVGALWALMYVCFITALGMTTVANVLVLASLSPFAAALLGRIFLAERVAARVWLTMAAAFIGIVVMFVDSFNAGGLTGNLLALAIPISFACNVVILRKTQAQVDMIPTLVLSGLFSMAVTAPLAQPFTATQMDVALLAIMGVVQLGIGCLLMLAATPRLAAAEIGLLAVLETVFGTASTWLFVGEHPGRLALLGGLVVIGALVVNELIALRRRIVSAAQPTGDLNVVSSTLKRMP